MTMKRINSNCSYVKFIKTLDLLARPRGFEPLTLGLEMRWIEYTNDLVLRRFVILQIVKKTDGHPVRLEKSRLEFIF